MLAPLPEECGGFPRDVSSHFGRQRRRAVRIFDLFMKAETVVAHLVAAGADSRKAVMGKRVGVDMGGDAQQVRREGAIRQAQMMVPHLLHDPAVHAAFEALRVILADVAGNEMERRPDPALILIVKVGEVDGMMRRGFLVDARPVAERHMASGGIVVDELRRGRDGSRRLPVEACGASHSVRAIVVHVDLHRSLLRSGASSGGVRSRAVMCAFGAGFQGDTAIEPLPVTIRSALAEAPGPRSGAAVMDAEPARYSAFGFSETSARSLSRSARKEAMWAFVASAPRSASLRPRRRVARRMTPATASA